MWNWPLIDQAAEQLGATYEQRKKWRQRGFVPEAWHWRLVQHTKGRITVFEKTPAPADQDARQ